MRVRRGGRPSLARGPPTATTWGEPASPLCHLRVSPPPAAAYFASPAEFRRWLERFHETERELLVGFHKRATARPSMTWAESVAEALCFGWIDGIRRRVDDERYTIRFTPRKAGSIWSAVNVATMERLIVEGRAHAAGLRAFERRSVEKSAIYSYENRHAAELDAASAREFRRNRGAWAFFQKQAPWYRRTCIWWVISAKRPDTRAKRLATLIACSAEKKTLPQLTRKPSDE